MSNTHTHTHNQLSHSWNWQIQEQKSQLSCKSDSCVEATDKFFSTSLVVFGAICMCLFFASWCLTHSPPGYDLENISSRNMSIWIQSWITFVFQLFIVLTLCQNSCFFPLLAFSLPWSASFRWFLCLSTDIDFADLVRLDHMPSPVLWIRKLIGTTTWLRDIFHIVKWVSY